MFVAVVDIKAIVRRKGSVRSQIGVGFVAKVTGGSPPAVTRIPAGLSCYQASLHLSDPCHDSSTGMAAAPLVHEDNSVSCSFGLTSAKTGPVFSLADLHLKLRNTSLLSTANAPAAVAAEKPESLLYSVEWTVLAARAPENVTTVGNPIATASPALWSLHVNARGLPAARAMQRAPCGHGQPARDIMRQMQALQQTLQCAEAKSDVAASMAVHGLPEGCLVSPAPAKLSIAPTTVALMRVAAQEVATVKWATCAYDAASTQMTSPLAEADSFACAMSAGVWMSPRLESHKHSADSASLCNLGLGQPNISSGTVIVSGGLGNIGLLAVQWIAAVTPSSRPLLLGRSGRSSKVGQLAAALCSAGTEFSVARCDVGIRDEVEGLLADRTCAGSVQPYVHVTPPSLHLAADSARGIGET